MLRRVAYGNHTLREGIGGIAGPFYGFGLVALVGCTGVVMGEDGAGERLNFAEGDRLPSERVPRHTCGFNAATYA